MSLVCVCVCVYVCACFTLPLAAAGRCWRQKLLYFCCPIQGVFDVFFFFFVIPPYLCHFFYLFGKRKKRVMTFYVHLYTNILLLEKY